MGNRNLPDKAQFVKAMAVYASTGSRKQAAAAAGGRSEQTIDNWIASRARFAAALGVKLPAAQPKPSIATASEDPTITIALLRKTVADMKKQLTAADKEDLTAEFVKRKILGLKEGAANLIAPDWLVAPTKKLSSIPGVPTLFASDWHWGEHVFPGQIAGKNEYNLAIANRRARRLIEQAIDLLENHVVNPVFPGIVFALGGDMVSGGIHEELAVTDEKEIMPVVLEVVSILVWCIKTLADHFGRVFVPCVTGNHGRDTQKIRAKGRNFTSFDWLIYQFTRMKLEGDNRITFFIPDGSDALYRVYDHRYLLTHGDQFRGGDGMIGALGPIIRGDHKKRSRNAQIGMEYDTMLIGHWHQYIHLTRLIVNGSLKGYDEYAYQSNFGFERARQALWLTHPKHGITFAMPVYVDESQKVNASPWVSIQKEVA